MEQMMKKVLRAAESALRRDVVHDHSKERREVDFVRVSETVCTECWVGLLTGPVTDGHTGSVKRPPYRPVGPSRPTFDGAV